LCVFENACFKNTYFHNLQCEISEVGVAYLKATNLHTSKKVEEKHVRLAKFRVVFITAICNAQWMFPSHIYSVFAEIMGGAK